MKWLSNHNPRVGGSSPSSATKEYSSFPIFYCNQAEVLVFQGFSQILNYDKLTQPFYQKVGSHHKNLTVAIRPFIHHVKINFNSVMWFLLLIFNVGRKLS